MFAQLSSKNIVFKVLHNCSFSTEILEEYKIFSTNIYLQLLHIIYKLQKKIIVDDSPSEINIH